MQGRLNVTARKPIGWTISGSLPRRNGPSVRVRLRATSNDYAEACQEAAKIESEHHATDWHGPKGGALNFKFDAAIEKYLDEEPRSAATARYVERLREAIGGGTLLSEIGQDTVTHLRRTMFAGEPASEGKKGRPPADEETVKRGGITPLLAILEVAKKHGMIKELPHITKPSKPRGETEYFLPSEAEAMVAAAADHLKPLIEVAFCTGMRGAEMFELQWRNVDLVSARILLWPNETKGKKRRVVLLPPRAVAVLASLKERDGLVFRKPNGEPYADTGRQWGGQAKKGWQGARERAGLADRKLTLHTCRHSWASWHYALYKDPLRLMIEGGWKNRDMVDDVYAHLLPGGHEQAIRKFWGLPEPMAPGVTQSAEVAA
jgi:integrase